MINPRVGTGAPPRREGKPEVTPARPEFQDPLARARQTRETAVHPGEIPHQPVQPLLLKGNRPGFGPGGRGRL